ncbi:MAG: Putative oxidoreductase, partial [uncultured Rubrobacteraceae bacterium]
DRAQHDAGRGRSRNLRAGRRPGGEPPRLRGHEDHGRGHLGRAGGPRGGQEGPQALPGARHKPHRHRRLLRSRRLRAPHRRDARALPGGRGDRHEGRPRAPRARGLEAQRPPRAHKGGHRGQPEASEAGDDRPLPTPSHRPRGAGRGVARHHVGSQGRGQGTPRRALRGRGGRAAAGAADSPDRLRAEPLQPHRPGLRRRAGGVRVGRDRLYPVVPARLRLPLPAGRPGGRDRRQPRGHPRTGRPRLAAPPLAGDAPDTGHLLGRPPRRERRRGLAGTLGRRVRRALRGLRL